MESNDPAPPLSNRVWQKSATSKVFYQSTNNNDNDNNNNNNNNNNKSNNKQIIVFNLFQKSSLVEV